MPPEKARLSEQREDGLYLWCTQGCHFKQAAEFTPSRGTNPTANCQACRDVMKSTTSNRGRRASQLSQTSAAGDEDEDAPPTATGSVIEVNVPQEVEFGDPNPNTRKRKVRTPASTTRFRRLAPSPTVNPYATHGHSQKTAQQVAVERELFDIQRRHRVIRRGRDYGEESPSPTPNLSWLLRRNSGGISGGRNGDEDFESISPLYLTPPVPDTYFTCDACDIRRPISVILEGVCLYCQHPSQTSVAMELMYCIVGTHTSTRNQFDRPHGPPSRIMCNACYYQGREEIEDEDHENNLDSPEGSEYSANSRHNSIDLSPQPQSQNQSDAEDNSPLNTPVSRGRRAPTLNDDPPLIDYNMDKNNEEDRALSDQDWKYLQNFNTRLQKETILETCNRCKERWFNMKIKDGVCNKCRTRDAKKKDDEPYLFHDLNAMDPGAANTLLPRLNHIEEMLIAPVHVMVEIHQHRGGQFSYKGHVCNFLRDVAKIHDRLPLFPSDLEIIILKPSNDARNPGLERQFTKEYRVRKKALELWLEFLRQHHPGYTAIAVNVEALTAMPEDGSISSQLTTHLVATIDQEFDQAEVNRILADRDDDDVEVVAIPNQHNPIPELEALQEAANRQTRMTNPSFRQTPLDEFNRTEKLLSSAFPTLYPYGKADFLLPRIRDVSYSDYVEHLIKYKDLRFAHHPRWRYVTFNTYMRAQATKKSTWFVNKEKHDLALDREALQAAFVNPNDPQAKALLNSIVRYANNLRGTRPFWNGKRTNLETYVHTIGSPDVFVTASAADMHWDSLIKCYGDRMYTAWINGDSRARYKIAFACLRDNPHIAAYHFHRRFLAMMHTMIKPKFQVDDWWNRYEFQQRNSSHNHGFVWTKAGPKILDLEVTEQRQAYANHWGVLISGCLPKLIEWRREDRTMMSIPPDQDSNTLKQLSVLVNTVQKHICGTSYCMRVRKGTPPAPPGQEQPKFCRFWAPWALQEDPSVDKNKNPQHYMFSPSRNNEIMNGYVALLTMAWKANMDFSPCTSTHAVMNYLAKYCTKEEKKSTTYMDLAREILPHISSARPLLSMVAKIWNKLIGERDWGAQEVMHIMLNLPLQDGSRNVINLDCRFQEIAVLDVTEDGEVAAKALPSKLEKYLDRPGGAMAEITFFEYLTSWDWRRKSLRTRGKDRLINYYPRYKLATMPEDYARVKMMLHHSFRGGIKNLLQRPIDLYSADDDVNNTSFANWTEAYQHCSIQHSHHPKDGFGEDVMAVAEGPEDELFEPFPGEPQQNDLWWAEFAAIRPGRDGGTFVDPESLGNRPTDLDYNWRVFIERYIVPDGWLKDRKAAAPGVLEAGCVPQAKIDSLGVRQRQLFDLVVDQAKARQQAKTNPLHLSPPEQLLYHCDGRAGTGKSFTIHAISSILESTIGYVLLRAAPTGVAAHSIQGRTIHSLLRLPLTTSELPRLSVGNLGSLQRTFADVTAIIIDEKSMLSLTTLSYIDQRLREICSGSDEDFGGIDVGLWGDFFQLPPVRARTLFNSMPDLKTEHDKRGQRLYKRFNKTVELDVLMRQQGPAQEPFRQCLEGLRNNAVSIQHWQLLSTRVQSELPQQEVATFADALRLYGKKADVNEYNHAKMRDLGVSVRLLKAEHVGGSEAEKASWDQAGNLHSALPICIGARIMLTENLWTEKGLVNGALGTVRGLYWSDRQDFTKAVPTVLIQFDKYDGPTLEIEGVGCVPIVPSQRDFVVSSIACSRLQVPLTIAWAITIHKAQGITAPQIVTNLAEKEHVVGLHYVAVSRVKEITHIMFETPFDYSMFRAHKPSPTEVMRLEDATVRRTQHVSDGIPE